MYHPRSQRYPGQHRTRLRTPAMVVPARVLNVSATGCLFQVDGPLRKGQRVAFDVLGRTVRAQVVRDQVGRAAVTFETPLGRNHVELLRYATEPIGGGSAKTADRTTALRVMSRTIRSMGARVKTKGRIPD